MIKSNFKATFFLLSILLLGQGLYAQNGSVAGNKDFEKRYENTIKGNLTMVANSIITKSTDPNENYNGNGNNNNFSSAYIDIDGDASTFSSSSADYINGQECSRVVYAGLYWSATYPLDGNPDADDYPATDNRADFRSIKFKTPGGNYIDINPTSGAYSSEVVFDGYPNSATNPTNEANKDVPYVCYADVTSLIQPLADPTGTYTIANVRGYVGNRRTGGTTGGWILIVVHENPLETKKYVASYDGFTSVTGSVTTDYQVDGFNTIPNGPVRAEYSIGALEGDKGIVNDNLNIRADQNTVFTRLSNAGNPGNNFFNSSITVNGNNVMTRVPNSSNTLGFDADNFLIPNALNLVVPNSETGATFRVQTSGDAYSVFMNAFAIEIIAPDLFVTKRVFDTSNIDITGGDVTLGQEIFYELEIQNIGNDDAVNTYIIDDLPLNVNYQPGFLTAPPGVTVTYDAALRQLRFDIDPSLLEVDDAPIKIRFKAKVIENCAELRDACSNIIENTATSFYQGSINPIPIENEPSFYAIDACNTGIVGSSNFLINTEDCDFTRKEVLCGNSLAITAGDGYDSYTWTDEAGNVIGTTQTITVTQPGTYSVFKEAIAPCVDDIETVIVDFFSAITNPLVLEADNVRTCGIDGSALPEFFLCGINDFQLINLDLQDASNISWQQRDPDSCPAQTDLNCPNTNASCVWNEVETGPDFRIDTPGQYRIRLDFVNGCFRTFYFNVYQNTIDPDIRVIEPVVCGNPGSIEVLDVPSSGYEFSLDPAGPYQSSPVFDNLTVAGNYTVFIRQENGLAGACVFQESIDLPAFSFDVNVVKRDILCRDDKGSITIQVTNGQPNYEYRITNATGLDLTHNTVQSTHTFSDLDTGVYEIEATGSDGVCRFTQTVEILKVEDLTASATVIKDIDCTDGLISIVGDGGTEGYQYAIYSYNGNVIDSSNYQFQGSPDFYFVEGEQGTYEFILVDQNNCIAITAPVEIRLEPALTFTTTVVEPQCHGDNTGSIAVNVTSSGNGSISYSIDGGINFQSSSSFTGLPADTYEIVVRSSNAGNDCETTSQVILNEPANISADINLVNDLTCDADARIEVLNVTGGSAPYEYSIDGNNFSSTNSFDVTSSGNYSIIIRDSNGCIYQTAFVTVTPIIELTGLVFNQIPLTCPSLVTDVEVVVSGGTGPFVYELIAPAGSATNNGGNATFNDLEAGTYTIRVTDSKNCFIEDSVTIDAVDPITVTGQRVSNVSCFGDADGAFRYTVNGFSNSYDYSVTGPINFSAAGETSTSLDFTGPAGTYEILVTDNTTNCTSNASVVIQSPTAALEILDLVVTPFACAADGSNAQIAGSVRIQTAGGWGSNRYSLTAPNGSTTGPQSSPNFTGLNQSGTYTASVTDLNGCTISQDFNLDALIPPSLSLSLANTCFDPTVQGTIIANVNAGTGLAPFQYRLDSGSLQSSNTFSNLLPGTYVVTVIDQNNCIDTATITIDPELTLSADLIKNLDCTSSPDALIDVTAAGGDTNYSYEISIDNGPFTAYTGAFPYVASGPGEYRFRVSDTNSCIANTRAITVEPITNPDITGLVQMDEVQCNGDATASFQINLDNTLGQAPYLIDVNGVDYGTQTTIAGLTAGTYNVTVSDANGCIDVESIIIAEPDAITADVTFTDIECSVGGYSPASINIQNVNGGTAEYTYSISNNFGDTASYSTTAGGEPHTFSGLNFGFYNVTIEDSRGCSIVEQVVLASPPNDLDIDVTPSISDCASGASVIVTVGAAVIGNNYRFGILTDNVPGNNTFFPSNRPDQISYEWTGLLPGVVYTFIVADDTTGCYYIKESEFPTETLSNMTATIAPTDVSCFNGADGSVSFELTGFDAGATSIDYQIYVTSSNTPIGPVGNSPVSTPPGSLSVDNFGVLDTGRYFIVFTENGGANDGCTLASEIFEIEESTRALELSVNKVKDDNCNLNAGVITATASYGTAPYEYIILPDSAAPPGVNDASWNSNSVFNVEGGSYIVYVKDDRDCIESSPAVLVDIEASPILALTLLDACVAEGSYEVQVDLTTAGIGPYTVSIDGGAPVSVSNFPYTMDNLGSGSHTIRVTDSNGCFDIQNFDIDSPLLTGVTISQQPSCSNNDGVLQVQGSGGSGNYTFELLDSAGNPTTYNIVGNQFTGIPFGNYIVRTTDVDTNCTIERPTNLQEPENIQLLPSTITDVSCNGSSEGEILVNLDPAFPTASAVTYELFDSSNISIAGPQSSDLFTGLPAGTYRVLAVAGSNCAADQTVVINEPSVLSITASATAFACAPNNSVNLSQITVTINNDSSSAPSGTAPYSYSIDGTNFQTENTFEIVDTGAVQNITVTVTDSNGCTATDLVTIQPLPTITNVAVTQGIDLTCNNDEQVTVSVTGGSGTFTYELLPSGPSYTNVSSNSQDFNLSNAGSYTFRITDENTGCFVITTPYIVDPAVEPSVSLALANDVTCFGAVDGTLEIRVQDYTGPYSYEVRNANSVSIVSGTGDTTSSPEQVSNLPPGRYTVFITESNTPFCSDESNSILINGPAQELSVSLQSTNDLSCSPGGDAAITVTAINGWGDYSYSLNGGPFTNQRTYNGLSAGTYTLRVRDRATDFCEVTTSIIIEAPAPINASAAANTLICNDDTTATITVNATGGQGVGSYYYQLNYSNGSTSARQTSPTFNSLAAGTYTVTVSDDLNCEVTTNPVTINNPPEIQAQAILSQSASCLQDASITVNAMNGQAPYEYSQDGISFTSNNTFNNLTAGTYSFYVRDANGCLSAISNGITVEPVVPLTATQDLGNAFINCSGGADANVIVNATGGFGNYRYELFDSNDNSLIGPQTNRSFSSIDAGTYYIQVTSADCSFRLPNFTVTDPEPIAANLTTTNISCFGEEDGSIIINASGGTGELIYSIDQVRYDTVNEFNNLPAGDYTVFVQDSKGCFVQLPVTITEPGELSGTSTIISQNVCVDDEMNDFEVVIQGGTAPFEISIDNVDYITITGNSYTFQNLDYTVSYPVFIRDANGCQTIVTPITFDPPQMIDASYSLTYDCDNGNILAIEGIDPARADDYIYSLDGAPGQLSPVFTNLNPGPHSLEIQDVVTGCNFLMNDILVESFEPLSGLEATEIGLNTYQIDWTGGEPEFTRTLNGSLMDSDTFTIQADGEYEVIVRDSRGCEASLKISLEFIDIDIPNFFTPDGNGENDVWNPDNIERFPEATILIFDRYGRLLSRYKGSDLGWNGIYQDKLMPSGDYWYAIELNDEDSRVFKGHFTLYR